MKRTHLYLVGFMGSGKTTIAALLAARSGRRHVELDAEVERLGGSSIADIFDRKGEAAFRRLEADALEELDPGEPLIVSTGGGAYLGKANRRRMARRGVTAWLDVSLEEARERIGDGIGRPLWRDEDPLAFRAFFERRRACYALADARFLTVQKTPKKVASDVFDRFAGFFD